MFIYDDYPSIVTRTMWCLTFTFLVRLLLKRFHVIVIAPSLLSYIRVVSSIGDVINYFTCRKTRRSFTIPDSATYSNLDYAAAVGFWIWENHIMASFPIITAPLKTKRRVS